MLFSGNTVELGDASEGPGKSFLFLLTVWAAPGIGLPGERGRPVWESGLILEPFGTLATSLENPAEWFIRTPGRTHNRIRSPR